MKIINVQRDAANGVITIDYAQEQRFLFPCCCYPTLRGRRDYNICELCRWEDDGDNDGGANSGYSLARARRNFEGSLSKYDEAHPYFFDDTEAIRNEKRLLMAAFDAFERTPDGIAAIRAWWNVMAAEESLRLQVRKRHEDEAYKRERHQRFLEDGERREPGFKARYALLEAEVAQWKASWAEESERDDA